ncbi:hypothetical protein NPIL_71071 [Nephila pilipes]|uniref:Uncharacterized protein n=1 Tax=Nephila pilipes TaxID=299642 RepID=A0A8X6T460_NEPPI|nr:hypothetical protein NPIL_71071 [Nephila pilipes]
MLAQDKWDGERPSVFSERFAQIRENSGSEVSPVPLEMEEALFVSLIAKEIAQVEHLTNSRRTRFTEGSRLLIFK